MQGEITIYARLDKSQKHETSKKNDSDRDDKAKFNHPDHYHFEVVDINHEEGRAMDPDKRKSSPSKANLEDLAENSFNLRHFAQITRHHAARFIIETTFIILFGRNIDAFTFDIIQKIRSKAHMIHAIFDEFGHWDVLWYFNKISLLLPITFFCNLTLQYNCVAH
ncbi:hypothetical protein ACJX0J_037880, partial [Zea mays]